MGQRRAERLQVMLQADEVRAVEAWRFENHMPSRSAAARALMNLGLRHAAGDLTDSSRMLDGGVSSGEIGVVDAGPTVEALLDDSSGPAILIAEHDLLLGHGLKGLLEEAGFQTHALISGREDAQRIVDASRVSHHPIAAAVLGVSLDRAMGGMLQQTMSERAIPVVLFDADGDQGGATQSKLPMVTRTSAASMLIPCLRDALA